MAEAHSRYVNVDGIRTHYREAGDGPPLVLFHSGEFGGCAELSWEFNIGPLSDHFRVIAPDWLGFGRTDKVHDFGSGGNRRQAHMQQFLRQLGIDRADFAGNSMSGGILLRAAATDPMTFPIRRVVIASGGGFAPMNAAREALLSYDCTPEGMKRLLKGMFIDPRWTDDAAYVERRVELSLIPGAWECTAAARFKSPAVPARAEGFGAADTIPYEKITVPTLVIAGDRDPLRNPGYAQEFAPRIANGKLVVFENCGHCPNIEQAERFNAAVVEFLEQEIPASAAVAAR